MDLYPFNSLEREVVSVQDFCYLTYISCSYFAKISFLVGYNKNLETDTTPLSTDQSSHNNDVRF